MTRKEQNKILDDKIESNVNQCSLFMYISIIL